MKRVLGRTGLKVNPLGYGSMGIRGPRTWGVRVVDDARAEAILHQVLDSGINLIDTAPDYGVSEERIGRFLGHRRGEFILATKCGCTPIQHEDHLEIRHQWSRDTVRENVEHSLKRLQTDYIDILQFHGGDIESLQSNGLIDELLDLKAQGVIRHIGMSNKNPDLKALLQWDVFDVFQVPYSCLAPDHEPEIEQAAARNAGVIMRGAIAQGGPDAEIQRPGLNAVWERAGLDDILLPGMSRAELILRHTLSHSACHVAIIGTCNADHLAENVAAAAKGPLPTDLLEQIRTRVSKALTR